MLNDNLEQQAYLIFENMMAKAEAHRLKGKYTEAKFLALVITGKEDANFSVPMVNTNSLLVLISRCIVTVMPFIHLLYL